MIVKISAQRGTSLGGLVGYLFGKGKSNEHTDPHLVAAHTAMWAEGAPRFTGRGELARLIADVDGDKRLFAARDSRPYVWHASMAIPISDQPLTDAQGGNARSPWSTRSAFPAPGDVRHASGSQSSMDGRPPATPTSTWRCPRSVRMAAVRTPFVTR